MKGMSGMKGMSSKMAMPAGPNTAQEAGATPEPIAPPKHVHGGAAAGSTASSEMGCEMGCCKHAD